MYCLIARFIIFLLQICTLVRKCTSWVQPQIGIYPGFLDIYSASKNFANNGDLVIGQPYTFGIHMENTDRYDYLLQSCTYNDKYRFVDQNSCLVYDKFFLKMWENDMYQLQGATKRTFIHFVPPEPLTRLECSVRILYCCGCAERACERRILPTLIIYPQQVINVAIINDQAVGILATSVGSWPWWIWLLIALGLILLLCLLPLLLLLYSQLCMHKRKVSDSKAIVPQPLPAKASNILVRAKEMEENGASERPSVLPQPSPPQPPPPPPLPTRIFGISSDSPSESIRSTASQSHIAVIRQQQPRMSWADRSIRSEIEPRPTLERHIATHNLESVTEKRVDLGKCEEAIGLGSKFPSSRDEYYIRQIDPKKTVHQQTTCEEKFFKKRDRQNRMVEEGYDRAQLTYTTPERHFAHSEIV